MTKRPSLASFSPKPVSSPARADSGRIDETSINAQTLSHSAKYPKISVYLTQDEIRTLKLLGIDNGQRISDICAAAIREWLHKNGHERGVSYKA